MVSIQKKLFDIQHDLYLGCVYLPPAGSNHEVDNAFLHIEHAISSFPPESYVLLSGDMNARCQTQLDYIESNDDSRIPEFAPVAELFPSDTWELCEFFLTPPLLKASPINFWKLRVISVGFKI